jgi:hypothetical protein
MNYEKMQNKKYVACLKPSIFYAKILATKEFGYFSRSLNEVVLILLCMEIFVGTYMRHWFSPSLASKGTVNKPKLRVICYFRHYMHLLILG